MAHRWRRVVVVRSYRKKRLLAVGGGDGYRLFEAEAQPSFWTENGGLTAREQYHGNARDCSSARADAGTFSAIGGCADNSASASGGGDSGSVVTVGSARGAVPKFSDVRKLLAIDDVDVAEFKAQLRNAFYAAGFLCGGDVTDNGLAAARYDPAVHDDRLIQRGCEAIALVAVVAGETFIQANENDFAGWNGESSGNITSVLCSRILAAVRSGRALRSGIVGILVAIILVIAVVLVIAAGLRVLILRKIVS